MDTFPVVARTLGQFIKQNEVWCVSWLVKLIPTLPAGLQAKAKEFDKDSAPQQMYFLLHAGSSWVMPAECRYVKVAVELFEHRVKSVGDRHGLLTQGLRKFMIPSGAMQWDLGVYGVKLDNVGHITHVVHRPTGDEVALDESEGLDKTWGIANNYSDIAANFVKGKHQCLSVAKFFGKLAGPNKVPQWSGKVKAQDQDKAAEILAKVRRGSMIVDDAAQAQTKAALDAPAALKRKEAASRARAKLEMNQAELKHKRVVHVA